MPYGLPCAGYTAFSISVMDKIKVYVERNGAKRFFYSDFWNGLPAHKYGWVEIKAPLPEAVAANMHTKPAEHHRTRKGVK